MAKYLFLRCPSCKSTDVGADASAYWNPTNRLWEMGNIFDTKACNACGEETEEWISEEDEPVPDHVAVLGDG